MNKGKEIFSIQMKVFTYIIFLKFLYHSICQRRRSFCIISIVAFLEHIFGLEIGKDYLPVSVFCRVMSNVIFDLVLYLQYEWLNISLTIDGTIQFQYLKTVVEMEDYTLSKSGS